MLMIPFVVLAMVSDQDREFMAHVFEDHQKMMFRIAQKYSYTIQDAEDIMADSCISLIDKIPKLKTMNDNEMRSYIVNTVRNTAFNFAVKRKRKAAFFTVYDEKIEPEVSDIVPFEERISLESELESVRKAIHQLPEKERDILELKYFQGKTDSEIAPIVGLAEASIRKYVERARNRLKKLVYKEEFADE